MTKAVLSKIARKKSTTDAPTNSSAADNSLDDEVDPPYLHYLSPDDSSVGTLCTAGLAAASMLKEDVTVCHCHWTQQEKVCAAVKKERVLQPLKPLVISTKWGGFTVKAAKNVNVPIKSVMDKFAKSSICN